MGVSAISCGRQLASPYTGYLYVARKGQRSVAVIDLANFRWAGTVEFPAPPSQLVRAGDAVFAVCPEISAIVPMDVASGKAGSPIRLPGSPSSILVHKDTNRAIVVSQSASHAYRLDLKARRITARAQFSAVPFGYDLSETSLTVALPGAQSVQFLDATSLSTIRISALGVSAETLRFRLDGQSVLLGAAKERQIATLHTASGKILSRLSIPISPERFCFNGDGGQMFVSGAGGDVVSIINPYQNEVDQTILAGGTPGAMVATERLSNGQPALLLVANRDSGDVTMIDIETRGLAASVHVGQQPGSVMVTPDQQFALTLNRLSGDVSVIRLKTVLDHKNKTKPLFTVVPVGAEPVSAVIMPRLT